MWFLEQVAHNAKKAIRQQNKAKQAKSHLRVFLSYPLMMYRWDDLTIPPTHPSRYVVVQNAEEEEIFRQQGYRPQIYKHEPKATNEGSWRDALKRHAKVP